MYDKDVQVSNSFLRPEKPATKLLIHPMHITYSSNVKRTTEKQLLTSAHVSCAWNDVRMKEPGEDVLRKKKSNWAISTSERRERQKTQRKQTAYAFKEAIISRLRITIRSPRV